MRTVHVIQTRTLYFYRFCLLLALVQCDYEAINHAKYNLKESNCETLLNTAFFHRSAFFHAYHTVILPD